MIMVNNETHSQIHDHSVIQLVSYSRPNRARPSGAIWSRPTILRGLLQTSSLYVSIEDFYGDSEEMKNKIYIIFTKFWNMKHVNMFSHKFITS